MPRSTASAQDDARAVAGLVRIFFAAFTSGADCAERIEDLRAAFLPGAVVVRTCGADPVVYDVDGFLAPRLALLTGGTLTDFREWPLTGRTDLWGDVAQHVGGYAKSWEQDGARVEGRGFKTLQFVRTPAGWRISAAAWDDEREGLVLPAGWVS